MISVRGITYIAAGLLALAVAMPPEAKADAWNQKTVFTFSGPVEIPGQVLPPGTYVFKLLDTLSDRSVVQVFNKEETHLFGTILAIPDYRLRPRGKTILTFEERAAGAPEAIKAWFYPGENYGHDFVYPKVKAMALAQANNQAVPSMTETSGTTSTANDQSSTAMQQTPLMAQQPDQQEVEVSKAFAATTPEPAPEPTPAQAATPAPAPAPTPELPQTGSPLPLIGLIGLMSLGVAGSLRLVAARMK